VTTGDEVPRRDTPTGDGQASHGPPRALARTERVMLALGIMVVAATGAAAYDHGRILLTGDEPLQEFVESHRFEPLTSTLELLTLLGHQNVIIPVTLLFAVVAWHRCRIASFVLAAFTVARILIHLGLKDGVARDRPDLDPLVEAVGNSYPSGHVISAVLIWGLAPFIVGLLTPRRSLWYATAAFAGLVMAASTLSRFYLGVHWFSDALVGLVIGWVLLLGTDVLVRRHHDGQAVAPGRLGKLLATRCPASPFRSTLTPPDRTSTIPGRAT
jgi:undecaprenyl-diphosphatase